MTIIADIKRVMRGHSDRALIHAVGQSGLEYKLEIPLEEAAALPTGGNLQLVLSWSVHAIAAAPTPQANSPQAPSPAPATPNAAATATPSAATPATPTASSGASQSADERFMALMRGRSQRPSAAETAPDPRANERRLAELLGYKLPPQP